MWYSIPEPGGLSTSFMGRWILEMKESLKKNGGSLEWPRRKETSTKGELLWIAELFQRKKWLPEKRGRSIMG
jgi:hypothetical protein